MTSQQSAMARAALGWSRADLASASGVAAITILRFETDGAARPSSVDAIRAAFERANVSFIAAGEASLSGGPGVRLS